MQQMPAEPTLTKHLTSPPFFHPLTPIRFPSVCIIWGKNLVFHFICHKKLNHWSKICYYNNLGSHSFLVFWCGWWNCHSSNINSRLTFFWVVAVLGMSPQIHFNSLKKRRCLSSCPDSTSWPISNNSKDYKFK